MDPNVEVLLLNLVYGELCICHTIYKCQYLHIWHIDVFRAAIAIPGNISSFHIHDFQGLRLHVILNWTFGKLL
jgi:hypothetical protein